MGYYQTPICKWGKRPITVMGVAEDYGLYVLLVVRLKKSSKKDCFFLEKIAVKND